MNFERIIGDVAAMNLNLYDLALYSDGRIQSHCFCPCNRCNNSYSVAKAFTMTAVGLLWEQNKHRSCLEAGNAGARADAPHRLWPGHFGY